MPAPRPGVPCGKLAGRRKRTSRGAKLSASRWSQTWLPVVTTSAPASSVVRKISSVMPKPPAAFSPLTMTKSSRKSEISPGSRSQTAVRPVRPTMSPRKRTRMPRLLQGRTESAQAAFGQDFRQHDVVRLIRNTLHLLAVEGDADQPQRVAGRTQPPDRAIVIAAAIADAMAAQVEGGERHQHQCRVEILRLRRRTPGTKTHLDQRRTAHKFAEDDGGLVEDCGQRQPGASVAQC